MTCDTPCSVCPHRNSDHFPFVPGDGPLYSEILFIGEKPHKHEHAFRKPFIGDSGEELNQSLLPLAGLDRYDIRINNAVRCAGDLSNPELWETAACSQHHLPSELASMLNLTTVVLMGSHACSLVPGLKLDLEHGIPSKQEIFGREYVVFPMYHPALGLHQTGMIREIRDDFVRLRRLLSGEWDSLRPIDEHPVTDYSLWDGEEWDEDARFMGADTETDEGRPYCFTWSLKPGIGRLVWSDDVHKVREFTKRVEWFMGRGGKLLIHNAMFDLPVFAKMGIIIPWEQVIDTMVMAYHRWLPQGLKTLAYRLCGMRMQDYSDLVGPYVEVETYEYLHKAARELEARAGWRAAMAVGHVADWVPLDAPKKKGWMYRREHIDPGFLDVIPYVLPEQRVGEGGKMHRDMAPWKRILRITGDVEKGREVGLRERWKKIPKDIRGECERVAGRMPPDSIRLVPREEVVEYAIRDADAALRVYYKMLEVGERLKGEVSEEDYDNHSTTEELVVETTAAWTDDVRILSRLPRRAL